MQSETPTPDGTTVRSVDRDAIARAERRRQVLDALEEERDRAAALQEQIAAIVTELDGPGVDEAVFASMAPEDAEIVRRLLHGGPEDEPEDFGEEWLDFAGSEEERDEEGERAELEAEIVRLQEEIAASNRQQQALERYLDALGR
jgi:hypothetical protein